MTLPNLKQYIYSALDDKSPEMMCVEARLNLMQATFLILQTSPVLDDGNIVLTNAYQVFQTLLNRYFDENLEVSRTDFSAVECNSNLGTCALLTSIGIASFLCAHLNT